MDEGEKSEGFWKEFFLLRPDRPALRQLLDEIGPNDLLHLEHQTRQLFACAIATLKNPYGVADLRALDVSNPSLSVGNLKFLTDFPCRHRP